MGNSVMRNAAAIILILLFVLVGSFIASPAIRHRVHWMRYGYDRVWYHNRDYVNPHEYTAQEVEQELGQGQTLVSTGDTVIGLPVYDTLNSLAFQKRRHVVSTLLLLKESNGKFIVYELSGGP